MAVRALAPALALALSLLAGGAEALTLATWLGGAGVWSDPASWDSNPLYPCNGNGGETFDVSIATGTATLDLDCEIEAMSLTAGTLDGSFDLTLNQLLTWSGGTTAGSGTTRAEGGVALSGTATKIFAGTRSLVLAAGSSSTWSAGSILLGSDGATLRNEAGASFTATGVGGRSLFDTADSGTLENQGVFTLALNGASDLLTLSPGSLTHSGALHVNTGILALGATGSHTGSADGAGTLRFSGGSQELAAGSSVTVADLEVTGGTLTVQPGATFDVGNLDIQSSGNLAVADGTTALAGTASQSAGTLGGAGTLETSGLFTWSGGAMAGSGTTRAEGGVALSGTATKIFAGTRSLVIAGGASTWSAGSILLGSDGATLRNEAGASFTATGVGGRSLFDTADSGTLENEGVFTLALNGASDLLTLSPGSLTHSGALHVNTGILALGATGSHTGSADGAGTLRFSGGSQELASGASVTVADLEVSGGTLTVQPGASVAVGNLDIQSSGSFAVADAGTTVTAGTASQSAGTLGGAGTLETSGLFTWSGGTMAGSGTTRAEGGVALSSTSTKIFADTRSLVIAGGSSSWSAGSITLGADGSTLRSEAGASFTATGVGGRSLFDTADSGSFENQGVFTLDLDSPASALTLSPGDVANSGTIELLTGTLSLQTSFTQTAGVLRLAGGTLATSSPLDIQGGALEGTGLIDGDVQSAGVLAPGFSAGQISVDGDLTLLSGSELRAELAGLAQGTSYDFVDVSGSAVLAGALSVSFLSGFGSAVSAGDQLTVLEAGAPLAGAFANVASGARVVTQPNLGSFAVSYGAGSPFGANRVVLGDFRRFTPRAVLEVAGEAQGGTITLNVEGVVIVVPTSPGQTAEQLAEAIADAINQNAELAALGIAAVASGDRVVISGGLLAVPEDTDAGIEVIVVKNVPALSALALALLGALLAASGARRARRIIPSS
jgi:hypothetical protein